MKNKIKNQPEEKIYTHSNRLTQLIKPANITEDLIETYKKSKCEKAFDRIYHASIGLSTTGLSPAALTLAYTDWISHLVLSPNKRMELYNDACEKVISLISNFASYIQGDINACLPEDKRFSERYKSDLWKNWPYNIIAQSHLIFEDWLEEASKIRGMSEHHKNVVAFLNMVAFSAFSPENFSLTNPEIQAKIKSTGGMNFLQGASNFIEDIMRKLSNGSPAGTEEFTPGKDVATTPGKVIFRNELFELIQYSPQTKTTYPEPVLIIPAWIMKYYILDLSPKNSMVHYMAEQGHTVFMISWKNPDETYRDAGFADYLKNGALQALKVVNEIIPEHKVHAVGYCIGGTLLAMLAAYLDNKKQDLLQTITLFAAQVDFTEAGQLMTFIDESQLTYLEDIMFVQGYLRGDQISAAFNLLKPRELIWHRMVQDYLIGERSDMFDLMAWDEDTTRLPYRMHREYLDKLYLHNQLAEDEFEIDGQVLDIDKIKTPMFVVSTEHDHIAPWKSVYKIHHLSDAEITFVLANRGHNGGIISEPGHEGRAYRIGFSKPDEHVVKPEKWMEQHKEQEGSWWHEWHKWLEEKSGKKITAPNIGSKHFPPMENAPGIYIHEK